MGRVGQHHGNAYWQHIMLRLGLAAAGSESAIERGEAFALGRANHPEVVTVVEEADPAVSGRSQL